MYYVFTLGHSNHTLEIFLDLLRKHEIEVLVDLRSQPYSRYTPYFNGPELKAALAREGIKYLFLGKELGGRPEGTEYYDAKGHVMYSRVAESAAFLEGISRLERGARQYRVVLLCGEENPAECHRRLLVGRVLLDRGFLVSHIRGDGRLQTEAELVDEEAEPTRDPAQPPLFEMPEERAWTSTRSVSRKGRRPTSSEP